MDNENMNKGEAEELLGLDGVYNWEEFTSHYHDMVNTALESGDKDSLERLDYAYEIVTIPFSRSTDGTVESEAYKAQPTTTMPIETTRWADIFPWLDDITTFIEERTSAPSIPELHDEARQDACMNMHVPYNTEYPPPKRSEEAPLWFRAVFGLTRVPLWRIGFIIVVLVMAVNSEIGDSDFTRALFSFLLLWLFVLTVILVNTVTGIFTDLLRVGIVQGATAILKTHFCRQEKTALKHAIAAGTAFAPINTAGTSTSDSPSVQTE